MRLFPIFVVVGVAFAWSACESDQPVAPDAGHQVPPVDAGGGDAGSGDGGAEDAGTEDAGVPPTPVGCAGMLYECGDGQDNDGDGLADSDDPECTGPCDNSEASWGIAHAAITGAGACRVDCYFDSDIGTGNDGCSWSYQCDPNEIAPTYYPTSALGARCAYDPTGMLGLPATCAELDAAQEPSCTEFCGPLTPNGCDAFGCCELPAGSGTFVFLGSFDIDELETCARSSVSDPALCQPCTPVTSTFNICEECELCIGKTSLPASCTGQSCPAGAAPCGLPGDERCAEGTWCVSGCCQAAPE